jgi:MinD superfamily P-loop ATPase
MKALRKKRADTSVVAVTGGKGGTGKTTVAVNLAIGLHAKGLKVLLADIDVDGPCCAMLLGAKLGTGDDVKIFKPTIDATKCVGCRACTEVCREHALVGLQGQVPQLFDELCSGCKACQIVCKFDAIKNGWKTLGTIYTTDVDGIKLVTGELKPTEPRSPIVARATVSRVIEELKAGKYDVAIVDTAPGVHNAVAQALWDADLALAVTEPTPLGAHDLKFILDLTRELELPSKIILNKADIPGGLREEVLTISREQGAEILAEIPLDDELRRSYFSGKPVVKSSPGSPAGVALLSLVSTLQKKLERGEI